MENRNRAGRGEGTINIGDSQVTETREPEVPSPSWPEGHVDVSLTGPEDPECILVVIHGVKHYLHSTTARELEKLLHARIEEWNVHARSLGAVGV